MLMFAAAGVVMTILLVSAVRPLRGMTQRYRKTGMPHAL